MVAKHVFVSGKVQGVGFRNFTAQCAKSLGVAGWARNTHLGQVEIQAKASKSIMDSFLEKISRGPSRAVVTGLEISDVAIEDINTDTFLIREDKE